MDHLSEYLPMFLAEGREHLQELNLAVVRIEDSPDDRTTVDEIFRIAHSLKGMSATTAIEPAPLIERLRELVRDDESAQEHATDDEVVEPPFDLSEMAQGRRVAQIGATLRDDVDMPAVRAYMVLAAVAKLGETLACLPAPGRSRS